MPTSRSACERKRDEFLLRFKKTDPKACATLTRDWERLVSFFDYPQEHWIHLRTTNIVESPFNAVRLRTDASRRFKKIENAEAMIWKLLLVAQKSWRALNAPHLMRQTCTTGSRSRTELLCDRRSSRQGKPPDSVYTPIDKTSVSAAGRRRPRNRRCARRTTAQFPRGASGGGLFDEQGRLVGVLTFRATIDEELNYAVPTEWVERLLEADAGPSRPTASSAAFWEDDAPAQPMFLRAAWLEKAKAWSELHGVAVDWTLTEPDNPEAWLALGRAKIELEMPAEAVLALRNAVAPGRSAWACLVLAGRGVSARGARVAGNPAGAE